MPPKPAPGKKGKDDQEDFSDVPTLPPLNSFTYTLLYQNFPLTEIREKLQKIISERIPQDRVKILTRDEILTFGKQKQIILEPNVAATLPQDDPRLKMTEEEQLAKATVDRLFELSVHARRAKKEKIQKLEEEAKAQPDAAIAQPDPDLLDVMFQLVDFPQTKSEAIALAKHGSSLNTVFAIDFVNLPPQEDDVAVDESIRDQFPMEISEAEQTHTQKIIQKIDMLRDARSSSVKGSQIRNMAIVDLEYFHYPRTVTKVNEQGEEVEEKKDPESIFLVELQTQLEQYGALYVKYLRFKDKVKVIPLMPDKRVLQEIQDIEHDQKAFTQWLSYADQALQQETISQTQKDQMDQASLEEHTRQQEFARAELSQEKKAKQEEQEERRRRLNELQGKLKNSIDDQKDYSQFKLTHYEKDFIQNKEIQNSIASVMSAMLTQLGDSKTDYSQLDNEDENTNENDSLDDLFSSFETEIRYDIKLDERPSMSQQKPSTAQTQQYLAAPNMNRPKRQGTEALSRQKTALGEIEYQEELDKAKRAILKLPKEVTSLEEEKAIDIYMREKNAYMNLVIPGADRHLMPRVPSKSKRIRDAENPGIYPFSTLPVDDAERALILKSMQELIKGNQIDECAAPEAKLAKYKVFERIYESHMQPEIMRQVIAEALIQDPDIATMYYQRSDSLLVALYNKVITDDDEERIIDGQKEWRAAYRVLPDFENWIKYFSDSMLIPLQNTNVAPGNPVQPLKYQLDDEMVPDQMLDIDDQKISNIQEQSQMLYPDDNSIMRVDNFEIGGQKYSKSLVIKDNLAFGLRKTKLDVGKEEEKEYGLASYNKIGDTELWIHFENDAKMLVETIQIKPNEQKLIRIDPPKPTPEEIAAREEAVKQAQIAAAKNKGKNSALGNLPPVEEYKEPEPTWEPEQPNFLDSYFDQDRDTYGPQVTTTYPNGLIVKHLFNGDICQTQSDNILTNTTQEKYRIITGKGVVIRQLRNKDAEVLYPNGYKSYFDRENMTWIITNNKGMRRAQKDGIQWDLDYIPCATETDAVTNAKMMIREDNVMTIQFQDGSYYCQHADGTQMRTSGDGSQIRIEKDGFAPIVIKTQDYNEWPQSQEDNLKRVTAGQRTTDGIIKETWMPDGAVVETFRDILDYEQGSQGYRHVFRRPDFSVVIADENGKVAIISSNARSVLNENGGKAAMGKDIDYAKEFGRGPEDFTRCVYYATISPEEGQSNILTVDERYKYILTSHLGLVKIHHEEQYETQNKSMLLKSERSQMNDDGREIEEVGGWKNPFTKHYLYPRLFVIRPNGSGWELLSKEQLDYYFRMQKSKEESLKQRKVVMVGSTSAKSHYFVTKVKPLADKEQELQYLKTQEYPQNAKYALLRTQAKKARTEKPTHHIPEQYLFRQIFEFQEFEGFKQDAFYDDLQRYRQWKLGQVRYDSEFGITHVAGKDQQLDMQKIEDEEYYAKRINIKILKERRTQRAQFKPEEFKKGFLDSVAGNEEMTEYHRRVTQNYERDDTWRQGSGNVISENYDRPSSHGLTNENITQENFRAKKARASGGEAKVKHKLAEIQKMLNTPTFIPNYFKSNSGQHFSKVQQLNYINNQIQNNPEKPPSQEVLMRMSQRINRSQHNTDKAHSQFDGQSQKSGQNSPDQKAEDHHQDGGEDKDNPIVALEPEDHYKQGSAFMGSKGGENTMGQQVNPSLYVQEKMYMQQREQEGLLKAEEYHVVKTKDFNVYGRLRQDKPFVKSIVKGEPITELNEKFITTELIADRRVKISSMAPRQYMNAPSVEDVRKQGQHQMILSAINKKQTFAELINQANSMVTGILHDPLKRCLNVLPSKCQFGTILAGKPYEMTITLKNEDALAQRITIKPTQDKRIVVQQDKYGPIAPGMLRKIYVSIRSNPDDESNVREEVQILTKSDIFKIPVEATILTELKYMEVEEESKKLGKKITNSRVRDRLNSSIKDGQYLQSENMDAIDQMISAAEGEPKRQWIETTGSESKLPKLPSIDKRPFDVDPKRTLKDVLKK